MVILGTLIGAGFASGKEIYLFFGKFEIWGIVGIVLSAVLSAIIVNRILKIVLSENVNNYSELLEKINSKYPKTNKIIKTIVSLFLLMSFFIMIAAFSAYMKEVYQIAEYISASIFVIVCYIVYEKSLQGMMKINELLVPILIIFIINVAIKNVPYLAQIKLEETAYPKGFLVSSLLYTSYNSIVLIPVLISMKKYIKNDRQIKIISILCIVSIVILSLCIYGLVLRNKGIMQKLELPLVQITKQFGEKYKNIYSFIIIASIFTSAISSGYSFLKNVSKTQKQYKVNLTLICVLGILVSKIGFSKLVAFLYPFFGALGILQLLMLLFYKNNRV